MKRLYLLERNIGRPNIKWNGGIGKASCCMRKHWVNEDAKREDEAIDVTHVEVMIDVFWMQVKS
jgi:hypothetical protein